MAEKSAKRPAWIVDHIQRYLTASRRRVAPAGAASCTGSAPWASGLADNERKIVDELNSVRGRPVDIGGYYFADPEKAKAVMRPSETFNNALASLANSATASAHLAGQVRTPRAARSLTRRFHAGQALRLPGGSSRR